VPEALGQLDIVGQNLLRASDLRLARRDEVVAVLERAQRGGIERRVVVVAIVVHASSVSAVRRASRYCLIFLVARLRMARMFSFVVDQRRASSCEASFGSR